MGFGVGQFQQMGFGSQQGFGKQQAAGNQPGFGNQKGMQILQGIEKGMKSAKKGRAKRELMQIITSSDYSIVLTPKQKEKIKMKLWHLCKTKINNAKISYEQAVNRCEQTITNRLQGMVNEKPFSILNNEIAAAVTEYRAAREKYDAVINNVMQDLENIFKEPPGSNNYYTFPDYSEYFKYTDYYNQPKITR